MKKYGMPVFGTVTEENPVVKIENGYIKGETREDVAIFRGIPYGGPCDGERRFLPPTKAADWEGVRDCTENAPYAVQLGETIQASPDFGPFFSGGHPERFKVAGEVQEENCLFLNVVTPGLDQAKRAVIFYIHGGGFAFGSGATVTGADRLVREQDVVLVGVNHRLNAFGYLYLGAFDEKYKDSGMAGMLDLVLALQWVQKNISVFGGDPEKVTLMGESGGAMKVNTLLAMESARGMYRAAFLSSGSGPVAACSKEQASLQAKRLLDQLGIGTDELDKLLEIPAKEIVEATREWGFGPNPVADDINLMYRPAAHWMPAEGAEDIPVVVGSSEDEQAVFAPEEIFASLTWDNIEEALCRAGLNVAGAGSVGYSAEAAKEIVSVFRKKNKKEENAVHTYLKIISQGSRLGAGAYYQAEELARRGKAPVYHYLIRKDVPHLYPERGSYAWHTAEIPLLMRIVLYPEHEKLSHLWGQFLGAFARTGNPSCEEMTWTAYDTEQKKVLVIDEETGMQEDPLQEERAVLEKWKIIG